MTYLLFVIASIILYLTLFRKRIIFSIRYVDLKGKNAMYDAEICAYKPTYAYQVAKDGDHENRTLLENPICIETKVYVKGNPGVSIKRKKCIDIFSRGQFVSMGQEGVKRHVESVVEKQDEDLRLALHKKEVKTKEKLLIEKLRDDNRYEKV